MPKLSELFVEVSSKGVDKVKEGIKDVDQTTQKSVKAIDLLKGALVLLGSTAILAGIKNMIQGLMDYGEKFTHLSDVTNISAEDLQKWSYITEQTNVSLDTFTGSLKYLTRTMQEARSGNQEMMTIFKRLGIAITDAGGNLRKTEDVFYDIVNALGKMKNDTERSAAEMKLLGRSGNELNPIIELGAEKLKDMGDRAKDLGLIIDEETLRTLDNLKDSMTELGSVIGVTLKKQMVDLLGGEVGLAQLTYWIKKSSEEVAKSTPTITDTYTPAIEDMGMQLDTTITTLGGAWKEIQKFTKEIEEQGKSIKQTAKEQGLLNVENKLNLDITKLTKEQLEELNAANILASKNLELQIPLFEHEIDSRNRLEKLRDNFLMQEARLAEELPENRARFEEWYETQVKIVNFMQSFLTPIFTDFYDTLISGGQGWEEFGARAIDALKRIVIELLAVATVGAILDAMGLGGVVRTLGALGSIFQTPSGDWWAQKEGYDMAKFFGLGFQQSLSNMIHAATPQNEPMMLYIEAEPGIIVRKMARMSLGHKRKFNKSVIKYTENRE